MGLGAMFAVVIVVWLGRQRGGRCGKALETNFVLGKWVWECSDVSAIVAGRSSDSEGDWESRKIL